MASWMLQNPTTGVTLAGYIVREADADQIAQCNVRLEQSFSSYRFAPVAQVEHSESGVSTTTAT